MDPISQGALGATLSQTISQPKKLLAASLFGALGGMAPDLDVLIRSSTDPLLFLEYHRHFTHSLFFIPIGGLIVGLVLHVLLGKRFNLSYKHSIGFATLGYATHALLDACTTYGTQLFWPFSDARIAWNMVSVVDPLYTLPILLLCIFAMIKTKPALARIALAWALIYPTIGMIQRDRAIEIGHQIASQRGHMPIRLEAKPSFANLLVWKTVYEAENRFYVDAVRVGWSEKVYQGESAKKLISLDGFSWLDHQSQQARDIERFRWFSNDYLAKDPHNDHRIIDVRYSMIPNQVKALWSIELIPGADNNTHVNYITQRDRTPDTMTKFWGMILGN